METVADLVARDRRSDRPALRAAGRELDYRRLCDQACKAGNYLRHHGVAAGRPVVVADAPAPQVVLTVLGAAQLGASVHVGLDPAAVATARVVVVPVDRVADVEAGPGTKLVAFGGDPDSPTVDHWEAGVWSENPASAPSEATPDDPMLSTTDGEVSHRELLRAADRVVDRLGIGVGDEVELRGSLRDPSAVAAGVVGPLSAGAIAILGSEGPADEGKPDADDDAGRIHVGGETLSLDHVPR